MEKKYRQSFRQFGSVGPDLGPHCLKKNGREDAPTHPLTEIPGIAHERQTRIQVRRQLLYFCLSTPPPPRLLRSYEDGATAVLSLIR